MRGNEITRITSDFKRDGPDVMCSGNFLILATFQRLRALNMEKRRIVWSFFLPVKLIQWNQFSFNFSLKTQSIISSCAYDVTCINGCCRNNPCLNGGTCTEICEPTSVRYNCSCPVPFAGKHCEIRQKRSCQDYKAAGSTASGLYTVSDDNNQTFQVFCDFDSEPGLAWNLIESFSLSNKHRFQVFAFSLNLL